MNKLFNISVAAMAACAMMACSEKKPSNVIIAPKPVEQKPAAPQRMSDYVNTDKVEWLGKTYTVSVKRASSDSLPMVKDEQGNRYHDNLVRVKVTREDGSEFFNRVFSKKSFADYLDADTRENGALLGIVLVQAEGDDLLFGASVGSPDRLSDEYIPLVMKLSRMGEVSISRDTKLDADTPPERSDEDDV